MCFTSKFKQYLTCDHFLLSYGDVKVVAYINASIGDWRTHFFGSIFKFSSLFESQSPDSILPLSNYPTQFFRLQNASICNLDYYLSRYFTHTCRSICFDCKRKYL